jgi:4-hydroxy-3-polyprenylbenzoate decarboxylase
MLFREFLDELKRCGELTEIAEEVHWDQEAAAVTAMSQRDGGPALHFTRVRNSSGTSLVSALFSGPGTLYGEPGCRTPWTKLAIALGFNRDISYEELCEELLKRRERLIRPTLVTSGLCQEVVKVEDEASLNDFPIPKHYARDGGRYLTAGVLAVKDYYGRWANWGVCRAMVLSERELVVNIRPDSQAGQLLAEYERHGKPFPCCIFLGGNPAAFAAAAAPIPEGIWEAEIAGAYIQKPLELTTALTNDLLVPADAEMVIEGKIMPGECKAEGPFPEYVRYSHPQTRPVMRVTAITHRKNPVLPFVAEGCKVSDSMALRSVLASIELLYKVRTETQLRVRWIYLPVESRLSICVAGCYPFYPGHNFWLANFLNQHKEMAWFDKLLMVDSDINPADMSEVMNDWAQKTRPQKGYGFWAEDYPHAAGRTAAYAEEGEPTRTVVWDCCWDHTWKEKQIRARVSFESSFPEELQEQVISNWSEYGLPGKPYKKRVEPSWTRGPLYPPQLEKIPGIGGEGQ